MKDSNKIVKIRYSSDETGWAESLGHLRARIRNVPMTESLNLDDVVTLIDGGESIDRVDTVVGRVYTHKSTVRYPPERETGAKLYKALEAVGVKCEGAVPGMIMAAHTVKEDPRTIARNAGIEVQVTTLQMPAIALLN